MIYIILSKIIKKLKDEMKHRIRAAGLIIEKDCILLVLHRNDATGLQIWVPPGGGLTSADHSIFDTAKREIFEETGLTVQVHRISHIREFRDIINNIHHLEFFMPIESYSGTLSIKNVPNGDEDQPFIKEVRWIQKEDLRQITVYPEWLSSDLFWWEAKSNFPEMRYTESTFGTSKFMFGYKSKKIGSEIFET